MTLQQLKYVTTIANIGSISEAAKRLFVSQPSLTKAIKELERKWALPFSIAPIKVLLFLKKENVSSAMHAKSFEQAALLEEQYKEPKRREKQFSVSTQHYSFAVNAFVELLKGAGIDRIRCILARNTNL